MDGVGGWDVKRFDFNLTQYLGLMMARLCRDKINQQRLHDQLKEEFVRRISSISMALASSSLPTSLQS
jgi:hypothetical protein